MSDGAILIIIVIIVIIVNRKWIKGENSFLHGQEIRECPVCNSKSAIIDTMRDDRGEIVEVLRCMKPNCNVRIKNFEGPDLEEEMTIKQEGRLIDQADIRIKDMEKTLRTKAIRLQKLQEKTAAAKEKIEGIDISESEPEIVEKTLEPNIPKTNKNKAYRDLELLVLGLKTVKETQTIECEVPCEPDAPEPNTEYYQERQYVSDDYSDNEEYEYDTSDAYFTAGMDEVIAAVKGKIR